MNTVGTFSLTSKSFHDSGESQPTDREKKFSDLLSASLKQQHDGALDILLQGALEDSNPRMVGIVGRHLIHASAGQRQAIVNWTRMLSHEQLDEFHAQWHPIKAQVQARQTAREHKLHELLKKALQSANASYLPRVLAWIAKSQGARLVDVVASQFFHANEPQRQVMVDWVVTLPTDLAMRFVDGVPTLREALSQRDPHIAFHLEQAREQADLCAEVGRQYHRATRSSIGEIDRWSETLNAPEREAFRGGKRAQCLDYVIEGNSHVLDYLDARSMARLGLVNRGIRDNLLKHSRHEAMAAMKHFPPFHRAGPSSSYESFQENLSLTDTFKCVATKSEWLTKLAEQIYFFPLRDRQPARAELLRHINQLTPPHLRAQALTALMITTQTVPIFTRRARDGWSLESEVRVEPARVLREGGEIDEEALRELWQSAMNLDGTRSNQPMAALLHRSWGRPDLINEILREVHDSGNEHWKSTVLSAVNGCYQSINLHSEEQAQVLFSLMLKAQGPGPDFLAEKLLPDFITSKVYQSPEGFGMLLRFISSLTPEHRQKPSLIALADTLEHTWVNDYGLVENCAAMLKVFRTTEDKDLRYHLLLAMNKGLCRLQRMLSRGPSQTAVSRMAQEADEAANAFEGNQKMALKVARGLFKTERKPTLDWSNPIEPRTLAALAGESELSDHVMDHLKAFPESLHPDVLIALIKCQWNQQRRAHGTAGSSKNLGFFIDAIGQLPQEQQARPLRALMHLCSACEAEGVSKNLISLGELCRQSLQRAEFLSSLAAQCVGQLERNHRQPIQLPVELFESICNDTLRMSDFDRSVAYFALQDIALLYPDEIARTQLAKLRAIYDRLVERTPLSYRH